MVDDTRTEPRDIRFDLNGYFLVNVESDGVYLSVFPPEGKGRPVPLERVTIQLRDRTLTDFTPETIQRAVSERNGIPVRVANTPPELLTCGTIRISVSADHMKVEAQMFPNAEGRRMDTGRIKDALQWAGICHGLDDTVIYSLAISADDSVPRVVAKGTEMIPGTDASLEYLFPLDLSTRKPTILPDGRVDFHNLNLIHNVRAEELLLTKVPKVDGTPGKAVTGEVLNAPVVRDAALPVGRNVRVGEDNLSLFASIDGQVVLINNKINVYAVFDVRGDVGLGTGNIQFVGNVTIRGSVLDGFEVHAEGAVEVIGNISGGIIRAGGSVTVRGGIIGMTKGIVEAGGDVSARFIENGRVRTSGSVTVAGAIMHSQIAAGKRVIVTGKGLIVGGAVRAGEEISARMIGSPLATPTELEVGLDPVLREELVRLKGEMKQAEESLVKTKQAVGLLKQMETTQGGLPPERREMLAKVTQTQFKLIGQIEAGRGRVNELEAKLEESSRGVIRIAETVMTGVRIIIGKGILVVREPYKYCQFVFEQGEVRSKTF